MASVDLDCSLIYIYKRITYLEWELVRIQHLEKSQSRCKCEQDALLNKPHIMKSLRNFRQLIERHKGPIPQNPLLEDCNKRSFDHLLDSFQEKECKEALNPVEQRDIGRYLCVSVGFIVCCLDLQKIKNGSAPIISTLKLLEKGLPVSVALFKLGSCVYMIGGQEFPDFNNTPPPYWDRKAFNFLYHRYGMKGSSRDTYQLSLVDHSLCLSYCKSIPPLNKPKIWPIVEKIGSQIHVIDTFPNLLWSHRPEPIIPSHELLNLNDLHPGWIEFPPPCAPKGEEPTMYIINHFVVGERIYAMSYGRKFMVFDCKTCVKWELLDCRVSHDPFYIKHVAQLLFFVYGCYTIEAGSDMFVVIAMGDKEPIDMVAIAYLVKQTGQVLCFQRLPQLFEGLKGHFYGSKGKVFKVDDEEKTLFAMFQGMTLGTLKKFTFFSSFNLRVQVDQLDPDLLLQCSGAVDGDSKLPFAVERDFVDVDIKDYCVYEEEADLKEHPGSIWTNLGLSTCFF